MASNLLSRLTLMIGISFSSAALAQDALVLAISEGTSGGIDHGRVIAKYGSFANVIGESIKRRVSVVLVREFAQLEEGMKAGRFDLVMARPSDYPARGMVNYGYRYVAHAKPDGQCWIGVPKNASVKQLNDVKGKRWVFPEQAAYMTKFCTAELRDQGIDLSKEKVTYVREQSTIGPYLENGLADVGGFASYSGLAQHWVKSGHAIIHRSVSQPYFPLVAKKTLKSSDVQAIQTQLTTLETQNIGPEILKSMGIMGFDTTGETRLRELLAWLNKN